MSVTIILEATPQLGQKSQLLKLLKQYLPDTYQFKGFIDIAIYSEADSERVIFISQWQSTQAYQHYLQWRTETGVMGILGSLLTCPPTIRFLTTEIPSEQPSANN